VDAALERAGVALLDLDLIAVTAGPGLLGALLVGLQTARALGAATNIPVVGVNHLEGHLLAIRLLEDAPEPPFLGLVVSGGHTSLYLVEAYGQYRRLGSTRDDAAGEAYDKVGRLLGLSYPAGASIDALAQGGNPRAIRFPRAMNAKDVVDWSFSGLKTAVRAHVEKHGVPEGQERADLCASFQEAVADTLSSKALAAAVRLGVPKLVLCGGVAANSRLRSLTLERAAERDVRVFLPPPRLCTDNGAMIAVAGHEAFRRGVQPGAGLDVNAAWRP
jgi:N6-L-threonylcarbamoyladenine synthase